MGLIEFIEKIMLKKLPVKNCKDCNNLKPVSKNGLCLKCNQKENRFKLFKKYGV